MKWNRIIFVIGAAAVALVGLFILQMKWIQQSRNLIEEQFAQKVKMALCSAVEEAKNDRGTTGTCTLINKKVQCTTMATDSIYDSGVLESALAQAFIHYDIPGPYELEIIESALAPQNNSYCCSLDPLIDSDNHLLSIFFPGKKEYIRSQLSFMLISSILILLFLTTVFVLACFTLLRQKYLHQINIDFFNNMAHELRTPLTNVKLATHLFQKKHSDHFDDDYLKIVERENERMTNQVERVLHLARLENGKYQLEKENVDIGALLSGIIADMDIQIKEKLAEVIAPSERERVEVLADKFHLSNVFRNLLDNALKYASENPVIRITLKEEEGGVYILFEDNGIGICKEDQPSIFNKFQQVSTEKFYGHKGFGLGLSYVKMIIEEHRGFIKVFSELNQGSRFSLFLPHNLIV